jgi:hypothetical protein
MRILFALLICVFSSTLSAQTWEDISVAWKTEVGSISSSCTGIYEIEILSSGEKVLASIQSKNVMGRLLALVEIILAIRFNLDALKDKMNGRSLLLIQVV